MTIDIKTIYLAVAALAFIIMLYVISIKKLVNIKSRFTTFLLIIEEILGTVTFVYIGTIVYKAMENYEVFISETGSLADNFTYISIYFCISQVIMLLLVWLCKLINKSKRLIKKRRIIK